MVCFHCVCFFARAGKGSILGAIFLTVKRFQNSKLKNMAERDTQASEIAGHYKVKCPVFPEELKHRRSNNLLYLAQRGPMKASENLGNFEACGSGSIFINNT